MKRIPFGFIGLIYLIVGFVIAVSRHYITGAVVRDVLSAILAVLLWWLPLLGVSLHLH
jgi:hypothetical protein